MMLKTHLAFGAFFALLLVPFVNQKTLFIIVTLVSSLLPDIDIETSNLGRKKALRPLQWVTKHRGIIHSVTFGVIAALILSFIYPPSALPFFIGFSSHIFLDSFTQKGIRPFWPLKKEINGMFNSNGKIDKILFYIFAALCLFLLLKMVL
jgi:inner membrane protein